MGYSTCLNSSQVIGLLVGFGVLSILLIVWLIYLGEYAMLMPRLFKKRAIWSVCPFQFFVLGDLILLLYYLPIYFQSVEGASPIRSGVNNLPIVISVAIFAVVGGIFCFQDWPHHPDSVSGGRDCYDWQQLMVRAGNWHIDWKMGRISDSHWFCDCVCCAEWSQHCTGQCCPRRSGGCDGKCLL